MYNTSFRAQPSSDRTWLNDTKSLQSRIWLRNTRGQIKEAQINFGLYGSNWGSSSSCYGELFASDGRNEQLYGKRYIWLF